MVHAPRKAGLELDWKRVDTEEDYIRSLEPPPDPILSDHRLPQFDSVRALARLQDRQVDVPFHIVSGKIGEDLAVGLLREGAEDFVLKDRLAHLGPAVPRALERKNPRQEKRSAEQRLVTSERCFRALIERGSDGILLFSPKAEILYSSPSTVHILGYSREELAGRIAFTLVDPEDLASAYADFDRLSHRRGHLRTNPDLQPRGRAEQDPSRSCNVTVPDIVAAVNRFRAAARPARRGRRPGARSRDLPPGAERDGA